VTTNAFSLTVRAGGWHEVTNLGAQNRSRRCRRSLPAALDLFIVGDFDLSLRSRLCFLSIDVQEA